MKTSIYFLVYFIILLFVLSGCGQETDDPSAVAEEWFEAMTTIDSAKAMRLTCRQYRDDIETFGLLVGASLFIVEMEPDNVEADISDVTFSVIEQTSNTAVVNIKGDVFFSIHGAPTYDYINLNLFLLKEDGNWKVCGDDQTSADLHDQDQDQDSAQASDNIIIEELTPPTVLPAGNARDVTFSHDSSYLVVAHDNHPYISIYKRNGDSYEKLPDPMELPQDWAYSLSFSHDSTYLAVIHGGSPNISIYKRNGEKFIKLPNDVLSSYPSNPWNLTFNHDSSLLVVNHSVTENRCDTIYDRSGDSFIKNESMSGLYRTISGNSYGSAFSHDSRYLAIVGPGSETALAIFKESNGQYTELDSLDHRSASGSSDVTISKDSSYLALSQQLQPGFFVYKRDGDAFYKLPDPETAKEEGLAMGEKVAFSHDANLLAVLTNTDLSIYQFDGDKINKMPGLDFKVRHSDINSISFNGDSTHFILSSRTPPYIHIYKVTGN